MAVRGKHTISEASLHGRLNRENGKAFEALVERTLSAYSASQIAEINKSPEPMRILKPMGGGQFLTCFASKAQPDYCGTLRGGRAVVFECKHTDTGKINQDVVKPWQAEALEKNAKLGALCFVLVSFGFERFFKVPWEVWRDMKNDFGKVSVSPIELERFECRLRNGRLDFLATL